MKKVLLNSRSLLAFIHDALAVAITWAFAYLLRFNFDIPPKYFDLMFNTLIFVIPVYGVSFLGFSLYRGTWRFSSLPELKRILMTIFITSIVVAVLLLIFTHSLRVPRSIIILHPLLLILMMERKQKLF